jgi:hypothetical protein
MRRFFACSLLALSLTACASTVAPVETAAPIAPPVALAEPAPLSSLVSAVDIPYEQFTLPHGLTVVVHSDR